jgi:uncharacterized protein
MELTQEFIDSLKVNETALMKRIAENTLINQWQVAAVVELLSEGATVPFIARYRKERTGSLDEVQVRDVEHRFNSGKNLEERRIEIIQLIFAQGKLSEPLYDNIMKGASLAELEDVYLPYKKKRKTRGMAAIEKGLEPLADAMQELDESELWTKAAKFVHENTETPELSVLAVEDALQGAMDIIAERVSQDSDNRAAVKAFYMADGRVVVKGVGDEEAKQSSTYQMYWDYTERLSQIKSHRVLAINRGEREGALEATIDVDANAAVELLQQEYTFHNDYHKTAVEDGLKRLLSPAVIREIRGDQSDAADDHGVGVFSANLKNLLMQQPIKGTRVLGMDPGIRTGTKCACLDETGKYLAHFVFKNDQPLTAKAFILRHIRDYDLQLIAVGGGSGTKEVQDIVAQVIAENNMDVFYTVVDEDGASVYSASDVAREEFPELDLTIRGAISIGRRLQDPLAELVKIDPRSIGVGLYQHDVNQKKLSETLDEVVSSVVNNVGVNLNTASASLLKYVSGVNSSLAKKMVRYRDEKGKFASRSEIMDIPGMGPKTFEQCAGFLKILESSEPLDNTWVHPENYEIARVIRDTLTTTGSLTTETAESLKRKFQVGDATIHDIVDELNKPGRDPREGFPKPIMQRGVVSFEDLAEGMTIIGRVKNVVDFGAFVDVGVKETALVHISEMSDHFVQDSMDVVKVGDVFSFCIIGLDKMRRRISLSLRTDPVGTDGVEKKPPESAQSAALSGAGKKPVDGKRRVVVVKRKGAAPYADTADSKPTLTRSGQPRSSKSGAADDGVMYNPFAEAFKNSRK